MSDAEIKIARAYDLNTAFKEDLRSFLSSNPAEIVLSKSDIGRIEIHLKINHSVPVVFNLMLGEILHNARSALDSAFFTLVLKRAVSMKTKIEEHKVYFKIEDNKQRYHNDNSWHQNTLNSCDLAVLEKLQPFSYLPQLAPEELWQFVKKTPLARLRDLSNHDKHRQLKLVFVELNMLMIPMDSGEKVIQGKFEPYPWNDGDLIYSFETTGTRNGVPAVSADFKLALEEDIRPMNSQPIDNVIDGILQRVSHSVNQIQLL